MARSGVDIASYPHPREERTFRMLTPPVVDLSDVDEDIIVVPKEALRSMTDLKNKGSLKDRVLIALMDRQDIPAEYRVAFVNLMNEV